ncbi:hypothetical protein BCBD1442_16260 [Brucella ceti]|nr:hypothetical protein BCBD1442_16260 [Brucella ceti]
MHPIGTGFQHGIDFFAKTGKIGGKNGRGNGDGAHGDSLLGSVTCPYHRNSKNPRAVPVKAESLEPL